MAYDANREFTEIVQAAWPDWEIVEKIGSGAFATVFRAKRRLKIVEEKDSAIKIIRIPRDDSDWSQLLSEGKSISEATAFFEDAVNDALKEIRAMEDLSGNTNIVNIYDYKVHKDPDRNAWYILIRMEYLQKIDLSGMNEAEIIRLGIDVCSALILCRRKNIVHRDVSMDNIFVHDGNYKLGDFGVAKVLESTVGGMHSIAGKPLYMAPELYNGTLVGTDMDSVAKVDLYSLGILLYRLCNNMRCPFEDPDKEKITSSEREEAFRRRVIDGEKLPPPKNASPELAEIILKACEANPNKRQADASELKTELLAVSSTGIISDPKWHFLRKAILPAVAAFVTLVCLFLFVLKPILFPPWSVWSEWSEIRREIRNPDEIQEETRQQYKWWAAQCTSCGANNPSHGPGTKCIACGAELSDNQGLWKSVFAYSSDITFQKINNNDQGRYFDGKPYWFSESVTQYRYRSKTAEKEEENPYLITVYAPDSMTEADFETAKDTLRERLNILTAGRQYEWTEQDRQIVLKLPKSSCAGINITNVLQCYLTRACRVYLSNLSDKSLEVRRDDLESVEKKYGSISGVDPADFGFSSTEYPYIEISLTDEFINRHEKEYTTWDKLFLAQDIIQQSKWFYYHTFSGGDGKTYYIVNDDPGDQFLDIVFYNLTHAPLPNSLYFSIDLNSEADWQNPNVIERKGKNQCKPEEVSDPSVTFSMSYYDSLSDGQRLDAEANLTKRLDALGIPYALGTMLDENNKINYVVKIAMSRAGIPVMRLLTNHYSLTIGTKSSSATFSLKNLICTTHEDGNCFDLRLNKDDYSYSSDMEKLRIMAEEAIRDDGYLYIYVPDELPFFAASAKTFLEEDVLRISDLCIIRACRYTLEPIGKRLWLQQFLDAVIKTDIISLSLEDIRINEMPDGTIPSEDQYAIGYNLDTSEFEGIIRDICPSATVTADDRKLKVQMNLLVNEQLPEKAPELVKAMYEQLDMPSLYTDCLSCYLIDENNDDQERARIFIDSRTDYNSDTCIEKKYYCTYGIFTNGRLEPYKNIFLEKIQSMEFYQELSDKDGLTGWTTEWGSGAKHIVSTKPVITESPSSVSVTEGETATFRVVATGTDLSYQWYYKMPEDTELISTGSNGTSDSYSFTATSQYNGYTYCCKVTNGIGDYVWSSGAKLVVYTKPVITESPSPISVTEGETATFRVVATGIDLSYQWYYKIPGDTEWISTGSKGTSDSYSFTATTQYNGYAYCCKVTNGAGDSELSSSAKLTVSITSVITANPSAAPTVTKTVPTLSSLYNKVDTDLVKRSARHEYHYGPGTDYLPDDMGYLADNNHTDTVQAYFIENGWIFAFVQYSTTTSKFVYLKSDAIDTSIILPQFSSDSYFEGTVTKETVPYFSPTDKSKQEEKYKIPTGTKVKVFFQENNRAYAEYTHKDRKVRLWIPLENISSLVYKESVK